MGLNHKYYQETCSLQQAQRTEQDLRPTRSVLEIHQTYTNMLGKSCTDLAV